MRAEQLVWIPTDGWSEQPDPNMAQNATLVVGFGSRDVLQDSSRYDSIKELYPNAHIALCSTSGEIAGTHIRDNTVSIIAMSFDNTPLEVAKECVTDHADSSALGKSLASKLPADGLRHVFLLSDGQSVNGSALVRGLEEVLGTKVSITGGLAGDGDRFEKTLVGLDCAPEPGIVAAVGFYGDSICVGYGSQGGWDAFGPVRSVTRSEDNVLYELDGKQALELYKNYLGDQAEGLPSTGLLFPLAVKEPGSDTPVVRTILAVDETEGSLTFAGEIPEGSHAQLMRANFDRLVEGAQGAAVDTNNALQDADVLLCISCVGRRLVLGQKTEEEIEEVRATVGKKPVIGGFYSYGEISPLVQESRCGLHNQTMTITALSER